MAMKKTDERYPVLVDLLARGTSRLQVARYFGVHIATSRRWLADPALRAEVARVQAEARSRLADVDAARERARAAALESLAAMASDPAMPPEVRLKAAQEVMGWVREPKEVGDGV